MHMNNWTKTIREHLKEALATASSIDPKEVLNTEDLNEILSLLKKIREMFLKQCKTKGFVIAPAHAKIKR